MESLTTQLNSALIASGLLPTAEKPQLSEVVFNGQDILGQLHKCWEDSNSDAPDWLLKQKTAAAALTWGMPATNNERLVNWLGHRLAWWPDGVARGRRIGLASSRLGRKLEERKSWFTVLRAACGKIDPQDDLLLSVPATTTARFVERCAVLFGLRVLRVQLPRKSESLEKWLVRIQKPCAAADVETVFLSPPLDDSDDDLQCTLAETPARDRAVVALADQLLVFHLRPRGKLDGLIRSRLTSRKWPTPSVFIATGADLVPGDHAEKFLDLGAVGWVVLDTLEKRARPSNRSTAARDATKIIPVPDAADWSYLTHCTRRADSAWPGQEDEEFLDDLIFCRESADHSALAALLRIVVQQRIAASSQAIRSGTPVVSFTEIPLCELAERRVFRPHRGRWDFEPYGICIRREWLERSGAKPVRYGDESTWHSLSADDRPFFQLQQTTGERPIDWSVEREWRHIGDVDLSQLGPDDAFVFVPTIQEAAKLEEHSPFPVAAGSCI